MKAILSLIILICTLAVLAQAQDQPKIPDLPKAQIEALNNKILLFQEKYNSMLKDFNQLPAVQQIQKEFNAAQDDMNKLVEKALADAKLAKEEYQLDLEKGVFVKREKAAEKK